MGCGQGIMPVTDPAPKPRLTAMHVSLFVAALSLCTAMYQGYLNTQAVGVFSSDVTHRETMRSCREAVEFFMEAKLRIRRLTDSAKETLGPRDKGDILFEARRTVSRFAAVATYLANFNEGNLREPYTNLARELEALVDKAAAGESVSFEDANEKFYRLNDDCVTSTKQAIKKS